MTQIPILKLRAKEIAELVAITPIEERAELYREVSKQLGQQHQFFTATLFGFIADFDERITA
ncbi:MAG: hypothetical protein M0P09_01475 [Acholeplasmataceae bacterium]|nr:hypothetical protein [Acholeplasmataceae bacterium]